MDNDSLLKLAIHAADVCPDVIIEKTKQTLRRMELKFPPGSLKKFERIRHIVAIEISCRLKDIPFKKSNLIKYAAVSDKEYQQALMTIKTALNLNWTSAPVIEVLAIRFGVNLKVKAYWFLEEYKAKYFDKLDLSLKQNIDLNSSVYHAVAFYLSAKLQKINIDKAQLYSVAEIDSRIFHSVLISMTTICEATLKNTTVNNTDNNTSVKVELEDSFKKKENLKSRNVDNSNVSNVNHLKTERQFVRTENQPMEHRSLASYILGGEITPIENQSLFSSKTEEIKTEGINKRKISKEEDNLADRKRATREQYLQFRCKYLATCRDVTSN